MLQTNTNKYFSYIRKSTDDGWNQKLTLHAQLYEINRFAKANGIRIVNHFEEKRSAKLPGRPVFREMIDRIKKGEATGIISWHPDRLSRNSLEAGELIYLLDIGTIVDFKFPQFWFQNNPQGKYSLYQAFAISKLEIDTLAQRVKTAYEEKARRGDYPTKAPPGYKNDTKKKTVILDGRRAPFVTKAFEMCASGNYTVPQIRSELTQAGFLTKRRKPLSLSKYHMILNHTFYYGIFRFDGEWYKGKHTPIISKNLFELAQKHLKRQERKWSPDFQPFLYRGRMKCAECGATITFEIQKGNGYLHCTKKRGSCTQRYMRQELMNNELGNAIREISLPKTSLTALTQSFTRLKGDFSKKVDDEKATLVRALEDLKTRQEQTVELLLKGILSEVEFKDVKRKLVEETATVEGRITQIETQSDNPLEPLETLLSRLSEATVLETSKNEEKKFEFLKKLGSNLKIANRSLQVTWEKPFELAAEWKKRFCEGGDDNAQKDTNWLLVNLLEYCSTRNGRVRFC
jgi:site-specific DNA recombinase